MSTQGPGPRPRQKRKRKERGATMVEFAIISVALFTLIFGIIEGAFAVQSHNAMSNAVDDAARRGAVAGTSANADWLILQQLLGRGADTPGTLIQYVVIYNGRTALTDGELNPTCQLGTPVKDQCNVYYRDADFDRSEDSFVCSGGNEWCPASRLTNGGIGFLGVYVRADYEPIIGQIFFEYDFEVNASSLQAIESSGVSS